MTITEFLLARVAEDEAAAGEEPAGAPWSEHDPGECDVCDHHRQHAEADGCRYERALAEVEAKRRIVALHALAEGPTYRGTECCRRCTAAGEYPADDDYTDEQNWPCPTLRALALPYADHAGYDEAWRL